MTESELRELGEDIKRHDLHTPVVIFTDQDGTEWLLDGRNRLDAMEIVGLPIVIDGELDPDIVHKVSGNIDPIAWVLSANLHRRHLTNEQKTELIAKVLELKPNASDRQVAKETHTSHPTVAKVRSEQERRGKISTSKTRTDTKGRKQPARKPPRPRSRRRRSLSPRSRSPRAKAVHSIAATLDYHFNALLALCGDASKWSPLSAGRKERRIKALKKLRTAWSELVELAKPAPRRGRPAKGASVVSDLLTAALEYAAKRLPVFPCVPNGKLPAIARGFYAATTNPETIKRYWRAPDRNIGIPTGSVSGFWVLDVDGDNGEANLFALEAKHGRLPPTREVITGGGGRHLWFKYTGPIQSTTSRIAPGVDTRGDGGYVIVPPSASCHRTRPMLVGRFGGRVGDRDPSGW